MPGDISIVDKKDLKSPSAATMPRPQFAGRAPPHPPPSYIDNSHVETASIGSSTMSLHPADQDSDEYDLPEEHLPAYDDEAETPVTILTPATTETVVGDARNPSVSGSALSHEYLLFPNFPRPGTRTPFGSFDPLLSRNPDQLRQAILQQASIPPRPFVKFQGSHTEQREKNGKKESETVTDFDITVDCGELFRAPVQPVGAVSTWHVLQTVPDYAKAYRGGFFMRRATPSSMDELPSPDMPTYDEQTLKIWCHLFCSKAAHSWFPYTFTLHRRISDWETTYLESRLTGMIRQTNYRGHVRVTFPVENNSFTAYSSHWMNRARANKYIWWACIISQLWIVTWPMLWFCTGRYEVVHVNWPYKKWINGRPVYLSCTEDHWLGTWGQAIIEAAFARRRETLSFGDLERVMQLQRATRENTIRIAERQQPDNLMVDTVLGIANGIAESRNQWDLLHGWGGDDNRSRGEPREGRSFTNSIRLTMG